MKAVAVIKTCEVTMNGLTATEVSDCLSVEAYDGFARPDSIKSMMQHCAAIRKKLAIPSFIGAFNERNTQVFGGNIAAADGLLQGQSDPSVYNNWLRSVKTIPDVVRYNLRPLHTILPNGRLKKCSETCKIGHRSGTRRDPCVFVCNGNQKSNCCPAAKGLALEVFKLSAQGLYGDRWTKTDGSVEVIYGDQIKHAATK